MCTVGNNKTNTYESETVWYIAWRQAVMHWTECLDKRIKKANRYTTKCTVWIQSGSKSVVRAKIVAGGLVAAIGTCNGIANGSVDYAFTGPASRTT